MPINVLAYVHLRNIYGSTGAGRVARQMIEHLAVDPDVSMNILADREDHRKIVSKVGAPWSDFQYQFFRHDTSRQQALWLLTHRPHAEAFDSTADVVYCTGESYVPTKRAKLVVTLHDAAFFEPDAHPVKLSTLTQKWKWKILYKVLSDRADLFHTVSQFSADRLAHFFPSLKSRLYVVPNAIPPRFFEPVSAEGESFLVSSGLKERPFILLPRGLHYRKNADLVLQAWKILQQRYPDLKLVVTSHCDPTYAEQAKALGDSVMLTDFVSDEALCSIYHAAQLVWFPSRYEGFGIPVLEAMACQTPVVASNAASLPEVAGDAAILVSRDDIAEHIEAISGLLEDAQLREEMRHRGALHAQQFTWQKSAAKLKQAFLSIC